MENMGQDDGMVGMMTMVKQYMYFYNGADVVFLFKEWVIIIIRDQPTFLLLNSFDFINFSDKLLYPDLSSWKLTKEMKGWYALAVIFTFTLALLIELLYFLRFWSQSKHKKNIETIL